MFTSKTLVKFVLPLLLLGWGAAGGPSPLAIAQTSTESDAAKVVDTSPAGELAFWNQIKDSKNADDFSTYLDNFPNGMFVDPAKDRYQALSGHAYDPSAATDTSKAAPEEPSITVAPKQPSVAPAPRTTAKAKAKPRSTVTLKTKKKPAVSASVKTKKKRVNQAVAQSRPVKKTVTRKKPARKAVAQTKPAVHKKKSKVATNRNTCTSGSGSYCTVPQPDPFLPSMGRMGGRSGSGSSGSGGGGGGGAGGWH
jgi:hypothetical protein